jgi:tetratricopeptide (TPR) repeat protein
MFRARVSICCVLVAAAAAVPRICAAQTDPATNGPATIADAYRLFYNAHYEEAAALAVTLRSSGTQDLENDEVRTSALLFQLRGLLKGQDAREGDKSDKGEALKRCVTCGDLLATFMADLHHGQALAREILKTKPNDEYALFFLGKLDLNYVWLQLGLLGKKTGWDEYWEARKSLEAVLKLNPNHVRARVARGWIDYIVNTRMPWGTRWVLGGGNKKRGMAVVREAAAMEADFFTRAEAEFALWDLHVRERDFLRATELAQKLSRTFPDNQEIARYLAKRTTSRATR